MATHILEVTILRNMLSLTGEIKGPSYLKPISIRLKIVKAAELPMNKKIKFDTRLSAIGTKVLAIHRKLLTSVLFKEDGKSNRLLL